jgi:L-lactate dehydrogenase complex protein LldF
MEPHPERFKEVASKELLNELSQAFLSLLPPGFSILRQIGMSSFSDPVAAENYSRAIRAEVIERLPELLAEFEKNASLRGAKVLWAKDAGAARDMVLDIARQRGVEYVTKGKSMITEEIGLNEHLAKNGVEAFETDLGEFIIQQLGLPPFHIVGPAINIPPSEISEDFLKKSIITAPTTDPVQLGKAVRMYLRDRFRNLSMGIVGVNMAVAETGTVINVENEGNIRMSKSSPRTLVAIMSLEKVVPTMKDAMHLVRILCRNCTGQKMSSYVSMDTGPARPRETDGPEELFIIILDGGRSTVYQDPLKRETLKCIRCGACLNSCPVYAKIGGYPYGFSYSGPMGQVLGPLLLGIDTTRDLYRACTLCGACKAVCPAGIDHPKMLLSYRSEEVGRDKGENRSLHARMEKIIAVAASLGMSRGWAWRLGAVLLRPAMNLAARRANVAGLLSPLKSWSLCRDLPVMPARTFHEHWKDIGARSLPRASQEEKP